MTTSMDISKHFNKKSEFQSVSVRSGSRRSNKNNNQMIKKILLMDNNQNSINTNNSLNFNNTAFNCKPKNKINYQLEQINFSPILTETAYQSNLSRNKLKDIRNDKFYSLIKVNSTSPFDRNTIDENQKTIEVTRENFKKTSQNIFDTRGPISFVSIKKVTSRLKTKSPKQKRIIFSNLSRQKFKSRVNSPLKTYNSKSNENSLTQDKEYYDNNKKNIIVTNINKLTIQNTASPIKSNNKNNKTKNQKNHLVKKGRENKLRSSPGRLLTLSNNSNIYSTLNPNTLNSKPKKIYKAFPKSPKSSNRNVFKNTSNIPVQKTLNINNMIVAEPSLDEQIIKNTIKINPSHHKQLSKPSPSISTIGSLSVSPKTINPIKKVSHISKISITGFSGDEVNKFNQDSYFICHFEDIKYSFIGICDGHGENGHLVSGYLKNNLPKIIEKELKTKIPKINLFQNIKYIHKIIENSFIETNSKLSNCANIDTNFSGSTCVSLLISNEMIFSANVGDSRAIKGTYKSNLNKWSYDALTRDHKACESDEEKRIIRFGGRIEQFKEKDGGYFGPKRVWLKKEEIPGLAMTRSFGDQIASSVGVLCEPEIWDFKWKEEDKFIILASDGLWEYMSNSEVISITEKFYNKRDPDGACDILYKTADKRWRDNDCCVDDITIIVIFLE